MQAPEIAGLNYTLHSPYTTIHNNNIPSFQLQTFPNQFYGFNNNNNNTFHIPDHFSPQSSGISSNSTSDEADEQNLRKHRRMISNRESARRSRMRKKKHIDELWSQVMWLRNMNHKLLEKVNHVLECYDHAVQENAKLKEQTSELHQIIRDMQMHSPCHSFGPLEDVPCNSTYLRYDSSNQNMSNSMDFLG
ncbi:hypothetical protein TanjilG_32441 [Lupinus angustifolius]|uniref:BZIP domain-containing protein n=1 Tax=Lupinus angustifolius TaxID=3871 RepID=A0A1J7IDU0_LUPAN|nr:PREDICTED: basic leucine zipper 43-like [Lupinus angustifolius]OIW12325.1 hypothetical protein TanjilG_32441 [Lupinus angustifolius]